MKLLHYNFLKYVFVGVRCNNNSVNIEIGLFIVTVEEVVDGILLMVSGSSRW